MNLWASFETCGYQLILSRLRQRNTTRPGMKYVLAEPRFEVVSRSWVGSVEVGTFGGFSSRVPSWSTLWLVFSVIVIFLLKKVAMTLRAVSFCALYITGKK